MTDKEFIKTFKKINLIEICKEVNVNYCNIMSGRAGYEPTHKVAEQIRNKLTELLGQKKDIEIVEFDNTMVD